MEGYPGTILQSRHEGAKAAGLTEVAPERRGGWPWETVTCPSTSETSPSQETWDFSTSRPSSVTMSREVREGTFSSTVWATCSLPSTSTRHVKGVSPAVVVNRRRRIATKRGGCIATLRLAASPKSADVAVARGSSCLPMASSTPAGSFCLMARASALFPCALLLLLPPLLVLAPSVAATPIPDALVTIDVDPMSPPTQEVTVDPDSSGVATFGTTVHVSKPALGTLTLTIHGEVAGKDWRAQTDPTSANITGVGGNVPVTLSVTVPAGTSSEAVAQASVVAEFEYFTMHGSSSAAGEITLARTFGLTASGVAKGGDRSSGLQGEITINNTGNGVDSFVLSVPNFGTYRPKGVQLTKDQLATSQAVGPGKSTVLAFTLPVEKSAPAGEVTITFGLVSVAAAKVEQGSTKEVTLTWKLAAATPLEQLNDIIPLQTLYAIIGVVIVLSILGVALRVRGRRKRDRLRKRAAARAAAAMAQPKELDD